MLWNNFNRKHLCYCSSDWWGRFTGCGQVLAFGRGGKICAWTVVKSRPSVTQGYQTLSSTPTCAQVEVCFPAIEIFVVLLYDRLSVCENKSGPLRTFYWKRLLDWSFASNICCAVAKLIEVYFQAGFCWGQSLVTVPTMPSACDYGWTRKNGQDPWSSLWTTLLLAGKACIQLIKCGQDKWCRGRCSCIKADVIVWMWRSVCKDWKCWVLAALLSKSWNVQEVV